VSFPLRSGFQDEREFFPHPSLNLIVVSIDILMYRTLAAPVEALLQQTADMGWVVLDAEVPFDDMAYSGPGPEVVRPSVSGRALQ
jgi:hypothetical protein